MNPRTFCLFLQFLSAALFFFFFFLLPSSGLDDDCAPQSCGGVSISYPFWLGGRQPPHCGPPQFELACPSGGGGAPTPVLRVISSRFHIESIFYHNRSLHLTVDYVFTDDCPIPTMNLTDGFYPFSASSSNKWIFFLLNCNSSPAAVSSYQNITCPSLRRPAYFGGEYEDAGRLSPAGEPCNLVVVPTMENAQGDYSELLKAGYLVDWVAPDCTACRESGGQCGYNETMAAFVCTCDGRSYTASSCPDHRRKRRWITIIGSTLGGLCCLCSLLLLFFLCRRRVLNEKNDRAVRALLNSHGQSLTPKNYKYSEIKRMTKCFSSKLGHGGYGTVYKGTLRDGRQVAVKLLRTEKGAKGNGEEFINEVVGISRTSHVNIVSLVGFCMERSKRALVYEFMPNGSLEKFVSSNNGGGGGDGAPLGWEKLFKIVLGIARGLEYLHRGCNTRIVHLDIKPHNVLLDKDFCPKISDFGLAKLCSPKESSGFSMASPRGTAGYISPEVFFRSFGTVSSKSDVYSYGMMVLELVAAMTTAKNGARGAAESSSTCSSEFYFPHWIYDRLDGDSDSILGHEVGLGAEEAEMVARKMVIVGLWCIQMMPENRPSMHEVVEMLERSTGDLQLPPKP